MNVIKSTARYSLLLLVSVSLAACASRAKKEDTGNDVEAEEAAEAPMGRTVAAEVMKRYPRIADEELTQYVNKVGQYVGLHLDPNDKNLKCVDGKPKNTPAMGYRVAVITSDAAVSFTVAGGYIFLTTAKIAQLKSEDQLAGVIAHEEMHALCGDDIPADTSVLNDPAKLTGYVDDLIWKAYPKNQLITSDRGAIVAMYRAGYYPNHYVRFVFETQNSDSGKHPGGKARAGIMQKDVAKMAGKVDKTVDARRARFEAFQRKVAMISGAK